MSALYIALFRGINVGSKNRITMEQLKGIFEELGFENPETYIQSGNIIFGSEEKEISKLKGNIEVAIRRILQADISVFVINILDLKRIFDGNPFVSQGETDMAKLHLTLLESTGSEAAIAKIDPDVYVPDRFAFGKEVVYIHCPNGYGQTRLNNSFFERKLKCIATTRNWNTIINLMQRAAGRL
jgi:uncharacterized protein (DUF1697 family)